VFCGYANKHNVKWSLSGSNLATESILPTAWGYDNLDLKHIQAIHRKFGSGNLSLFPTMSFFDAMYYQVVKGMRVARPLDLINYKKGEAMKELQDSFAWQYYGGKHYESRFTKFFQGWYLPTKWGYDKRLAHLSSLVASNEITRDQALNEFTMGTLPISDIESDKDYMARKLGICDHEFNLLMSVPNRDHSNYDLTDERVKILLAKFAAVPLAIRKRLFRSVK